MSQVQGLWVSFMVPQKSTLQLVPIRQISLGYTSPQQVVFYSSICQVATLAFSRTIALPRKPHQHGRMRNLYWKVQFKGRLAVEIKLHIILQGSVQSATSGLLIGLEHTTGKVRLRGWPQTPGCHATCSCGGCLGPVPSLFKFGLSTLTPAVRSSGEQL